MKKDFKIRKAIPSDSKSIHEVILAAFEEYRWFYSSDGFEDTVMSEDLVLKRMKDMTIFVAIDKKGKAIGTIGWKKLDDEEGHIRGMAVHPLWQGKNSPASALLNAVEKDAVLKKCRFLSLDTTEVLQRAQYFYKKHQFKESGKIGDFYGSKIIEYIKYLSVK
ncbi:MAG: GNAT family N-acetyltransferase [Candidatus Thorarchaeota archaeon]